MKLKLIPLFLLLLSQQTAPAQSSFVFDNRNLINAPVFDSQGNGLSGADYLAELYGSANADSLVPTLTVESLRAILPFRTGTNAGYIAGSPIMLVTDTLPGAAAWLQVRAWDSRLGATFESVASLGIGGYGESPLFYADGGNPLSPSGIPEPLIGLESFNLRPIIPEPSTSALLALGSVVIWMVRQRRRASDPNNQP